MISSTPLHLLIPILNFELQPQQLRQMPFSNEDFKVLVYRLHWLQGWINLDFADPRLMSFFFMNSVEQRH